MKEVIRYGLTLSLICIVASASLATVNSVTKSKIIDQANEEEEISLKEVMPDGERFETIAIGTGTNYYRAYDKNGEFIGIAFKVSAKGYSSIIETMVGLKKTGEISTIKVLSQNETPALGTRILEPSFTGQFSNINIGGLKDIQAITRATISSKAVIDSVTQKVEKLKGLIKNER